MIFGYAIEIKNMSKRCGPDHLYMMLAALDILGVVSERLLTIEAGLGRQRHNTNTNVKKAS